MRKIASHTLICFFALAAFVDSPRVTADEPSRTPSASTSKFSPDLSKRVIEITDAVLEHHIDPPALQQMILGGAKGLYRAAGLPVRSGLGRQVSAVITPEQVGTLIADIWPKSAAKNLSSKALEQALLEGLLHEVAGGAELISAKDRKVAEQLAGNRYVGIHIGLGMDDHEKRPKIMEVIEGGPADRAGVKKDDIVEQIDGVDTKGMAIRESVDRIRGDEGTDVTIKVRQPKEQKTRTMKMARGQLPRATVRSFRKAPAGGWDARIDGPNPIAYLRIDEISASTPHELHKLAQQLESEGMRSLVLDLRAIGGSSVHAAVLLADCLLEGGPIGRVRTATREVSYQADPDALFRGWPMAILVDSSTSGTAEWLAAALQDNKRATVVGVPTSGALRRTEPIELTARAARMISGDVRTTVPIGDGTWSIVMSTGRLERGDGRPLSGEFRWGVGSDSVAQLQLANRGAAKTGVQPDHVVGGTVRRGFPPFQSNNGEQPSGLGSGGDEVLRKAIDILRESLKKAETARLRITSYP
jgi:carboxyl-terminal processing protease